jgi:hypothetical protein
MCDALAIHGRILRPGKPVGFWRGGASDQLVWAGFARIEILPWWIARGAECVDVPAERFAKRSDFDRQWRWEDMPRGQILRGLIDPNQGRPVLRIVNRPSLPDEIARFQQPRMPVVEAPLFSAAPVAFRERSDDPKQGDLAL